MTDKVKVHFGRKLSVFVFCGSDIDSKYPWVFRSRYPSLLKNAPCPLRTEGVKLRGTTSGSSAPCNADLTVSDNTSRCFGRPRPSLLLLQKGHSGRYFGGFSCCLAPTGSSLAEKEPLTCSHHCVYWVILTKRIDFVKLFQINVFSFDFSIMMDQKPDAGKSSTHP